MFQPYIIHLIYQGNSKLAGEYFAETIMKVNVTQLLHFPRPIALKFVFKVFLLLNICGSFAVSAARIILHNTFWSKQVKLK